MQTKYIEFQQTAIQYAIVGDGQPVMLVHGFGEDRQIWANQVQYLKDNYRILLPDLPGSGGSGILKHGAGLEEYAEVLNKILIAESIDTCFMIGHSMGGYTTLAFAEKYAEKLQSFGLFHSSAFADDNEKIASRKKAIEFVRQHGAFEFFKTAIPGLFYHTEVSKEWIAHLLEKSKSISNEAVIQHYEAMIARPDRTEILKTTKLPVLFVLGEHDKAVAFEAGLKQTSMPAQSHVEIFRFSGHMGMLEETNKANLVLAKFLQNCMQHIS